MRDRSDWILKVAPWFIEFVFIVVIVCWIISGVLIFKVVKAVGNVGLKAVIERVWLGEQSKES